MRPSGTPRSPRIEGSATFTTTTSMMSIACTAHSRIRTARWPDPALAGASGLVEGFPVAGEVEEVVMVGSYLMNINKATVKVLPMTGRPRSASDEAIFRAVAEVVTSAGPAGLTLAAIARHVGLSAPALAQRFGSK